MSTKKAPEAPSQVETDIEILKKQVAHLEEKAKSQGSTIHLMHSMCESNDGMMKKMNVKLKKLAETMGVML